MLEKYPGVMVDPELMKEQDQQSKDLDKSMTLSDVQIIPKLDNNDYPQIPLDRSFFDIDIAATYPSPKEIVEFMQKTEDDLRFANSKLVTTDPRLGTQVGHCTDVAYINETPYVVQELTEEQRQTLLNADKIKQSSLSGEDANKGTQIVMLGGPRALASKLMAAVDGAAEVVTINDIQEQEKYSMKSYPTIGATALSMKHMATSPYAGKGKPRKTSFIEERRKEMRTSQKDRNKAQGYGQRITKKKPRKEPSNYEVKYLIEKEPVEHVIRVHATKTNGETNIDSVEHKFF